MQVRIGEETFELEDAGEGVWRVNGEEHRVESGAAGPHTVHLLVDGRSHVVTLERQEAGRFRATIAGHVMEGVVKDARALLLERYGMSNGVDATERTLRAPMPGLVVRVMVEAGHAVEAGQDVVVLEAMKMEKVLRAPAAGTVRKVHASAGTAVGKNDLLLEIE